MNLFWAGEVGTGNKTPSQRFGSALMQHGSLSSICNSWGRESGAWAGEVMDDGGAECICAAQSHPIVLVLPVPHPHMMSTEDSSPFWRSGRRETLSSDLQSHLSLFQGKCD